MFIPTYFSRFSLLSTGLFLRVCMPAACFLGLFLGWLNWATVETYTRKADNIATAGRGVLNQVGGIRCFNLHSLFFFLHRFEGMGCEWGFGY